MSYDGLVNMSDRIRVLTNKRVYYETTLLSELLHSKDTTSRKSLTIASESAVHGFDK